MVSAIRSKNIKPKKATNRPSGPSFARPKIQMNMVKVPKGQKQKAERDRPKSGPKVYTVRTEAHFLAYLRLAKNYIRSCELLANPFIWSFERSGI